MYKKLMEFYKGKRVFVTGHTGFKGSWLCRILTLAGAEVSGYSLEPPTNPSLYELAQIDGDISSTVGDIRDYGGLKAVFDSFGTEIVIHLAAQPLVRKSYGDPVQTYETNVMGTVNILECIRNSRRAKSFLNVTTDKVYLNREWEWGYRENDMLDGFDPYSNSKSCSELVTHSYKSSFFSDGRVSISTARAGNVIGGGDFASDRIIPDCIRAVESGNKIKVRNSFSVRPYQHVLEPLFAYLMIAARQFEDPGASDWYNVGPDDSSCITTGELVDLFCKAWGGRAAWENVSEQNAPHEANFLKLDCSKIKKKLGWQPLWDINRAVEKTVEWSKAYLSGGDIREIMDKQISEYLKGAEKR